MKGITPVYLFFFFFKKIIDINTEYNNFSLWKSEKSKTNGFYMYKKTIMNFYKSVIQRPSVIKVELKINIDHMRFPCKYFQNPSQNPWTVYWIHVSLEKEVAKVLIDFLHFTAIYYCTCSEGMLSISNSFYLKSW